MTIWDYIHGYAPLEHPDQITFYDHNDKTLYRDVTLQTIGQHGWELISVFQSLGPKSRESRYEYFFKRNREEGGSGGLGASSSEN